jgi:hypothetical protein
MIPGIGEEYPEGRGHIGDKYVQYCRGHSRERRDKNRRDYTPFHIYSDTEAEAEERDHISSIGANLAGGASGSSGNQAGSSGHQSPTRTYTSAGKIPRPLYPQFQGGQKVGSRTTDGTTRTGKTDREIHLQSTGETIWH